MKPQISLNELYQMRQKKDKGKKAVFDKVLELCHRRIRNIGSFGGMNSFYEIPGMVVGFPLFNIYDCTTYVVEQLRASGFMVQLLPPPHICVVYVSWDPSDIKAKHLQKALPAPASSAVPSFAKPGSVPPRLLTKTEPKKEVHFEYI